MTAPNPVHDRVLALALPELELMGYDLVELETLAGGIRLTLRFAVEKLPEGESSADAAPSRINVREVAQASRAIARVLEAEEANDGDFMPERYTIEVTSPGIFRRLVRPEHYQRYVGKMVKITAANRGGRGSQHIRGRLASFEDGRIRIESSEHGDVEFDIAEIRKAKLDPDLDFGGRDGRSEVKGQDKGQG